MKKWLLVLALTLLTSVVQAEDEYISYRITSKKDPGSVQTVFTPMGHMTPIQTGSAPISGTCVSHEPVGGESTLTISFGDSFTATVMPVESDKTGVKTLLVIHKLETLNHKWVTIKEGCRIPIGETIASSKSQVSVLKWGKESNIELPDGSIWLITANRS